MSAGCAINRVILWQNGMIMTFCVHGHQMPENQGLVEEMGDRLARIFPRWRWERATWQIQQPAVGPQE